MKKISDLAKQFQQTTNQELKDIEQRAKQDLQQHQQAIQAALKESEQKIIADIQEQTLKVSQMVFKPYLWILGSLSVVAVILLLVDGYMAGKNIQAWQKYQEIKKNSEKLGELAQQIQISTCTEQKSGKTYHCVAVFPNSPQWGKNGEYRAILPRQSK